jgi:hypothetical protein
LQSVVVEGGEQLFAQPAVEAEGWVVMEVGTEGWGQVVLVLVEEEMWRLA